MLFCSSHFSSSSTAFSGPSSSSTATATQNSTAILRCPATPRLEISGIVTAARGVLGVGGLHAWQHVDDVPDPTYPLCSAGTPLTPRMPRASATITPSTPHRKHASPRLVRGVSDGRLPPARDSRSQQSLCMCLSGVARSKPHMHRRGHCILLRMRTRLNLYFVQFCRNHTDLLTCLQTPLLRWRRFHARPRA